MIFIRLFSAKLVWETYFAIISEKNIFIFVSKIFWKEIKAIYNKAFGKEINFLMNYRIFTKLKGESVSFYEKTQGTTLILK